MTRQKNIRRYIAAACFAGAAVISVISLIKNISNNISYDTVSLIFSVLYMIGCALIAVSMFASVPVLTAVGGGLALLNAVRSLISFIKLVALDSNYLSIVLFNISLAAFQVVFFILIIIAGLNKKSAKVLGITAASVYGVRLLVYIICRLINYGYISMGLTAWLHYLFMILGAVMLGLVLYDMQAGYSASKRPGAQVSDTELFSGNSQLDQLGKAKMLLDAGVISKEEFTARKRNILVCKISFLYTKTGRSSSVLFLYIHLLTLRQKHPCRGRRPGRPNLRERPPRQCRERCRHRDRQRQDHKHSRRGIQT